MQRLPKCLAWDIQLYKPFSDGILSPVFPHFLPHFSHSKVPTSQTILTFTHLGLHTGYLLSLESHWVSVHTSGPTQHSPFNSENFPASCKNSYSMIAHFFCAYLPLPFSRCFVNNMDIFSSLYVYRYL